jgi:hypothetical protein
MTTGDEVLGLDEALEKASDELGLEPWYRDCVRPLLRDGPASYPRCCGGGCEPCSQLLIVVADRARELMGQIDASAAASD